MRDCEICGSIKGKIGGKSGKFKMDLCSRHMHQMIRHGKILKRTFREPNEFIVNGDITEIVMYNKDNIENGRALINTINLDIVSKYKYCLDSKGYVRGSKDGNEIYLHRLIANAPKGMVVDHIDHNKLNNLKENLRVCTNQENICNQAVSIKNTSGYTGVYWHKQCKKWQAKIKVNQKNISLGLFVSISDAVNARRDAEIKYFGEFRYNANLIDYKNKYNSLCDNVRVELENLRPWYLDGAVVDPMDAVTALKNIDRMVNQ